MHHLKIIREINDHSQRNYDTKSDHIHFLEMCNKSLFDFFNETISKDLVYSTMAYKSNERKTFEIVKGGEAPTHYFFGENTPPSFKACLGPLLEESQSLEKKIINLTNILLNNKPGFDLFFVPSHADYKDYLAQDPEISAKSSIKLFPLGLLKFNDNLSEFETINYQLLDDFIRILNSDDFRERQKYSRYLWHYKNLEKEIKSNDTDQFYIHFIRPSVIEFDYNLLLALATKRKLSEKELAFIDLLIYRVVGQTEVKKERERSIRALIQTTYSLGHNLKNRLLDSENHINRLIRNLQKSSLNGKEKEMITRYATNVSQKVKSLSNTGKLLDLIGRFMTERKWLNKWLTNNDYTLIDKFTTGELVQLSISAKYPKINIENLPKTLKVKGWLGADGKYRPADFVYEELFFELLVNALTYGKDYEFNDKYFVDINFLYEDSKILMVNSFKEVDKDWNVPVNTLIKPNLIGHGGLLYMYNFLKQTDIGDIDIFIDTKNNQFKIILELNGICHDE